MQTHSLSLFKERFSRRFFTMRATTITDTATDTMRIAASTPPTIKAAMVVESEAKGSVVLAEVGSVMVSLMLPLSVVESVVGSEVGGCVREHSPLPRNEIATELSESTEKIIIYYYIHVEAKIMLYRNHDNSVDVSFYSLFSGIISLVSSISLEMFPLTDPAPVTVILARQV